MNALRASATVGENEGDVLSMPSTSQGVKPGRVRSGREVGSLGGPSESLDEARTGGNLVTRCLKDDDVRPHRVCAPAGARADVDVDGGVVTRDALALRIAHPAGDDMSHALRLGEWGPPWQYYGRHPPSNILLLAITRF